MSKSKVSVIIPIFNGEDNLTSCLKSVFSQTLKEIEVICVDDGSTDNTVEMLKVWQKENANLIIKTQQNAGAGAARNLGLSVATGEYVAFMDADDWYPDASSLEVLYEKAKENHALVCGGSFSECKDGIVNTNYTGKAEAYTFTEEKRIEYKDFQFDYGYIRFIYSLDFLRANGLYFPPYRRFQDPPFFVSVMVKAKWFYAVPKVTYCYRKGEKRIRWTHEKINDAVKGMIDNLKISKENDLSKLHTFTVERLNIEYYRAIALNLTRDNIELMQLLLHANSIVEPKMLIENGYDLDTERQYMLRILSDLYGAWWRKVHPKSLIKRFIDLVKRAIICYKDNGLTYTIKRAVKKIGG